MTFWKGLLIGYVVLNAVVMVWRIDQPREPITRGAAIVGLLEYAGLVAIIAYLV